MILKVFGVKERGWGRVQCLNIGSIVEASKRLLQHLSKITSRFKGGRVSDV